MDSIQPLSSHSLLQQDAFFNFTPPLWMKILGVALVALAALGLLSYYLYKRFFKQQISKEITADSDPKETKIVVEALLSPKEASKIEEGDKSPAPPSKVILDKIVEPKKEDRTVDIPSQISQWTFTKDKIQAVLDIYQKAKDDKDEKLKAACEAYFQRAAITPGDHILNVYKAAKQQSELMDCLIEGAFKAWKADQNRLVIETNFQAIIEGIRFHEEEYGVFMATFLESTMHEKEMIALPYKLISPLSENQVESLTKCLLKSAKKPLEILKYMIKNDFFGGVPKEIEKIGTIFRLCLFASSPGTELQELLDASTKDGYFLLSLSNDELKRLILQWKTALDQKQLYAKLDRLFEMRSGIEWLVDQCLTLGINLDQYLKKPKKDGLQPQVCSAYVVHALQSHEPDSIKREKIGVAISSLSVPADAGYYVERYQFGMCLAVFCPTNQLHWLLTEIANSDSAYGIGNGMFTKILDNPKTGMDRIQKAFEAYWTCYQKLETSDVPPLSYTILPKIKTKEHLKAAYQAIPPTASDRKTFINLLKGKVALPQDVIESVVV